MAVDAQSAAANNKKQNQGKSGIMGFLSRDTEPRTVKQRLKSFAQMSYYNLLIDLVILYLVSLGADYASRWVFTGVGTSLWTSLS